jgi:tRNA A-37 threonylcarbamoyl transferase component Bud32
MNEIVQMDNDIEQVGALVWPGKLLFENAVGGLFNRVVRVTSADGVGYLKRFTERALSGNFPPLPTTATQRCLVAVSWHQHAVKVSEICPAVAVPAIEAVHTHLDLIAMKSVAGHPLYDLLLLNRSMKADILSAIVDWLATFHSLDLQPKEELLKASDQFKRFKVDLQYTKVLNEVPEELHPAASNFIGDYLSCNLEPVHGDINSRNVLVDRGSAAVIDFEQGHFGNGIYDLSYLMCEYVIAALRAKEDIDELLETMWGRYASRRGWPERGPEYRQWQLHLGFQTLYRLVGPSRKVWTGHLDEQACLDVRQWSVGLLSENLKTEELCVPSASQAKLSDQ